MNVIPTLVPPGPGPAPLIDGKTNWSEYGPEPETTVTVTGPAIALLLDVSADIKAEKSAKLLPDVGLLEFIV